jgi:hypothetical protein
LFALFFQFIYKIYQSDKFLSEVSYDYHALELMKFSDLKPLEKKVNDVLNYELCNRNMREIQALL